MKIRIVKFTACIMAILVLAGCAARTATPSVGGAPAAPAMGLTGLVLEYKMPAGLILRYRDAGKTVETTNVMGRSSETVVTNAGHQSFRAKGLKGTDHILSVTIDDAVMTIISPQGDLSPDLSSIRGKGFDMVLSPKGVEVDVSAAESLTFQIAGDVRNLASGFKIFFPDLPDKPVNLGDSWPASFVIEDKAGTMSRRNEIQMVNTFEAIETVDGMECLRIVSKLTGAVSGKGSQQGVDLLITGTTKGTDIWYFAPKEGRFVKSTSEAVSELTIAVTGPQSVTIPMTQKRTSEVKLVDRLFGFAGEQVRPEEHRRKLSQLDFDALDRKRDGMLQQYRLLDVGGVKPGMVVGEIGAGDGYLTFHLAARVGPTGKVYANDIVEEMALEIIRSRAAKKGIAHIETILGAEVDPRFPKDSLEAVFVLNAFHEFRDPVALLRNLVPGLKPGAKVVIHEWEAQTQGAIGPSGDRTYTRQEFLDIIARSPFQVETIDTSFPGTHPAVYVLSVKDQVKKEPDSAAILKLFKDLQASLR